MIHIISIQLNILFKASFSCISHKNYSHIYCTSSNAEPAGKLFEMLLWICVIVVTISMGSIAAPSTSSANTRRDYLNEIGMVCSFDRSLVFNFNLWSSCFSSTKILLFLSEIMDPCIWTLARNIKSVSNWMRSGKIVGLFSISMVTERTWIQMMMVSILIFCSLSFLLTIKIVSFVSSGASLEYFYEFTKGNEQYSLNTLHFKI